VGASCHNNRGGGQCRDGGQLSTKRRIGIWTIGNPVGVCIMTLETPKSRRGKVVVTKTGHIGQGLSWRAKAHRESENRESGGLAHCDIIWWKKVPKLRWSNNAIGDLEAVVIPGI
jgi:hypothetical protein